MSRFAAQPGLPAMLLSRLDLAIEILLMALLAFMPLAFGAVEAWSELVVILAVGLMGLCLLAKLLLREDARLVGSWAYLPIGLFFLLVVGQLLPLPSQLIGTVSPHTVVTRTRLLADLPDAQHGLATMTLSFYPPQTRQMLRLVLIATAVFTIVSHVYRRPEQVKRLLGAIAIIGGGLALLALAQDFTAARAIYWQVQTTGAPVTAGPFVNYNNFAQFMNLSIGAALALMLAHLRYLDRSHRQSLPGLLRHIAEPEYRIVRWLLVMIVAGAISIFLSGSRGGMISLLTAFTITALALSMRRGMNGWGWLLLLLGLAIFVVLLYSGFDAICSRLATLHDLEKASGGRWQINQDVMERILPLFPALGVGLGAHEMVYPMFSRLSDAALAGHVENEYLQMIEEMGLVGLALVAFFLCFVVYWYIKAIRRDNRSIQSAAFGLGYGLIAVLVHSMTDFGQRLPANACLSAVFCGLLLSLSRIGPRGAVSDSSATDAAPLAPISSIRWRLVPLAASVGAIAVWIWAIAGVSRAAVADHHWSQALREERRLEKENWQGDDADYARLLIHAAAAAQAVPDNVVYRHWLNVYRWYSISRTIDPQTGQIILTDQTLDYTRRIVDELQATRALCPTYGPTYCILGQLELLALNQPIGEQHIRLGCQLAPTHPAAHYVAGRLDAEQGRWEQAMANFQRCLALGHPIRDVLDVLIYAVDRPDLALKVAQSDSAGLLYLARAMEAAAQRLTTQQYQLHPDGSILPQVGPGSGLFPMLQDSQAIADHVRYTALASLAHSCAFEVLQAKATEPNTPAWVFASLADLLARREDYAGAADHYRRALALGYGNAHWHLALANILAASGQRDEAIHEARISLRLSPEMPAAKQLIANLSVQARTASRM